VSFPAAGKVNGKKSTGGLTPGINGERQSNVDERGAVLRVRCGRRYQADYWRVIDETASCRKKA
jgi:hypothetical protein